MNSWNGSVGDTFPHKRGLVAPNNLLCISWLKRKHYSSPSQTLCEGIHRVTSGFPSQRVNNTKSVSMLWRHNGAERYFISKCCDVFRDLVGNFEQCNVISENVFKIIARQINLVDIWRFDVSSAPTDGLCRYMLGLLWLQWWPSLWVLYMP